MHGAVGVDAPLGPLDSLHTPKGCHLDQGEAAWRDPEVRRNEEENTIQKSAFPPPVSFRPSEARGEILRYAETGRETPIQKSALYILVLPKLRNYGQGPGSLDFARDDTPSVCVNPPVSFRPSEARGEILRYAETGRGTPIQKSALYILVLPKLRNYGRGPGSLDFARDDTPSVCMTIPSGSHWRNDYYPDCARIGSGPWPLNWNLRGIARLQVLPEEKIWGGVFSIPFRERSGIAAFFIKASGTAAAGEKDPAGSILRAGHFFCLFHESSACPPEPVPGNKPSQLDGTGFLFL